MVKKIKYIVIVFLISAPLWVLADGKNPPPPSNKNNNFSKKEFSENSNFTKGGAVIAPPSTTDTAKGYASPISGGFMIILIGSTLFLTKKVRDDFESNHRS